MTDERTGGKQCIVKRAMHRRSFRLAIVRFESPRGTIEPTERDGKIAHHHKMMQHIMLNHPQYLIAVTTHGTYDRQTMA